MPNPWEMDWTQPQGQPGGGLEAVPLPGKPEGPPSGYRWSGGGLAPIPGGPAEPKPDKPNLPAGYMIGPDGRTAVRIPGLPAEKAEGGGDRLPRLRSLIEQINRVQQLYDTDIAPEPMGIASSVGDYLPTDANSRFDVAGAQLSDKGLAAFRIPGTGTVSDRDAIMFEKANLPAAATRDVAIEEQLRGLRARVDSEMQGLGLPPVEWGGDDRDPAAAAASGGAQPPNAPPSAPGGAPANPPAPTFGGGGGGLEAASGDQRRIPDTEAMATVDQMARSGASLAEINKYVMGRGNGPIPPAQFAAVKKFLRDNPGYEGGLSYVQKYEPVTGFERGVTALGNNPAGAFVANAGQFLSGNTLDNVAGLMGGDAEGARTAFDVISAQNPNAAMGGQIAGGIMAGATGEAALARLGMGSGLGRALLADTAAGSANGAGAADSGNRLAGAGQGAFSAAVGSLGGTALAKGAGKVVAPSGGRLDPLYKAGVRPTPGQRFADSGVVGRTVNAAEEALQSVPIVGSAIRGAREGARDQFQVGAFNNALAEIGERLPNGIKPGNAAHAYSQQAFKRVYDKALAGMRVVGDEELSNDLGRLAPDIETLSDFARNRLSLIMDRTVGRSIKDGELSGDGFKAATSDLRKHIGRFGKSTNAEERQAGEVLQGVLDATTAAARRHSDPDAVQLLDAADAGYSQLVRIEGAAARRGGDSGTFSPAQFDAEVQKASGGVRSKRYLRGDAVSQEYASAGRSLEDKMPNSGSADRAMLGQLATGGAAFGTATGALSPLVLGTLGAIGGLYAPGVRRATTGAFAPTGPARKAIGQQLERRARLVGRTTAAGANASQITQY